MGCGVSWGTDYDFECLTPADIIDQSASVRVLADDASDRGEALCLDLAVEVLKMRRQRMLVLASYILELRAPGIMSRMSNEDDVLREAGNALLGINTDVAEAEGALRVFEESMQVRQSLREAAAAAGYV